MSPIETMKAYYDAAKRKDIEAVKKFLSRGTLQVMEDLAKDRGKTVDQMFREGADRDSQMPTPEFSNEKINGDTATIDIKAPGQPLVPMQMVKEDGGWKLAIDKMMKACQALRLITRATTATIEPSGFQTA
jgi:flagellar hook-associated protein FlgK